MTTAGRSGARWWAVAGLAAATLGALLLLELVVPASPSFSRWVVRLLVAGLGGLGVASILVVDRLAERRLQAEAAGARSLAEGRSISHLADERARLESVLDSLEDGVLALDAGRRITLASRSAAAILGARREAVGRSLVELVRAPELVELLDARESGSVELELPGAESRRLLVAASEVSETGERVVTLRDVTAMRRLERVRSDFVANVSHELRTPVSVITANAETLLDGALDDAEHARGFVEAVHRHAGRLSRLVSDLLELGAIEAGAAISERSALALRPIADGVLDSVSSLAESRATRIDLEIEDGLRVLASTEALEQILGNLVENAVRHGAEGGRVSLRARLDEDWIRVEVEDDGPGIAPPHRDRIFERFYRVDPGRSRDVGGTGLGLAIVRNLVQSLGGEVGYAPREPRGSRFWVRLPGAS